MCVCVSSNNSSINFANVNRNCIVKYHFMLSNLLLPISLVEIKMDGL